MFSNFKSYLFVVDTHLDKELCKHLSGFIGPRLTYLGSLISEHNKKMLSAVYVFSIIYPSFAFSLVSLFFVSFTHPSFSTFSSRSLSFFCTSSILPFLPPSRISSCYSDFFLPSLFSLFVLITMSSLQFFLAPVRISLPCLNTPSIFPFLFLSDLPTVLIFTLPFFPVTSYSCTPFFRSDPEYHYVYFNHMNLAQKSTMHPKKAGQMCVAPEITKIICNINDDFARYFWGYFFILGILCVKLGVEFHSS